MSDHTNKEKEAKDQTGASIPKVVAPVTNTEVASVGTGPILTIHLTALAGPPQPITNTFTGQQEYTCEVTLILNAYKMKRSTPIAKSFALSLKVCEPNTPAEYQAVSFGPVNGIDVSPNAGDYSVDVQVSNLAAGLTGHVSEDGFRISNAKVHLKYYEDVGFAKMDSSWTFGTDDITLVDPPIQKP